MFEVVVTLCALSGAPCREALVPGYETATHSACEEALATHPVEAGQCKPVGKALDVTEIAPGVFVHAGAIAEPDAQNRGDATNLGFIIGGNAVAVIDSGSAAWMGEALWRAIRARTDLPVAWVILTHMHPDHVLGASVFADATVVGHEDLPRALADRAAGYLDSYERQIGMKGFLGTVLPTIDESVADARQIDLGGRVLSLRAWPVAHTGTDLTVLDESTGTFFAGDLVFDGHLPTLDGSLRGWQQVLSELQGMTAERLVPGHGGPVLGMAEAIAPMQRYLDVLAQDTLAAIDSGERLSEAVGHVAAQEANQWHLFDAYNPRNATAAFTELEWE
ncbi:MBL fold metallo-hydrolase [Salipiger pallidus]|uniref:MBL fold metallo-hydrolase n=1 Tax=Salipiger pallidus TaxID=1775170 RepID=A0A8J2ZLV2_9RHOB|nr:quinoprotein relay system zinc metallohydrolase 2 [Salipiger pallidus]GGG79663.1 MBL fold metallo-hydrolase [Salipiger pallidus]